MDGGRSDGWDGKNLTILINLNYFYNILFTNNLVLFSYIPTEKTRNKKPYMFSPH